MLLPDIEYIDAEASVPVLFTILLCVEGSLVAGFRDADAEEVGEKVAWVGVGVVEPCGLPDDIDLAVTGRVAGELGHHRHQHGSCTGCTYIFIMVMHSHVSSSQ